MTDSTLTATEPAAGHTNYGGFADAAGGIATIVLAIIALAGTHSDILLEIATIVFGAALLIHSGTMLSEYTHVIFPSSAMTSTGDFGGSSLSAVFLVGATGIVLGVLALLNIESAVLTSIAVIIFGCALVMSSNALWHLDALKRSSMMYRETAQNWHSGSEMLAGEMASGSAGVQALAGLAAIVLGILAVVGVMTTILTLAAFLVLGTTVVLTGTALSGAVLSFMRPVARSMTRTSPYGGGL